MIEPTINDGPMPTSRMPGCSRFTWPGNQRDSLDEETTDWRAVCEKTARTVRRAGSVQADPDPYQGSTYRHNIRSTYGSRLSLRSAGTRTLCLPFLLLLPLAQIILGGAHGRARRSVRVEACLGGGDRA